MYIYKTRRGRGFASYNRCMLHAYPNVPNSNTFLDSQGIQVLIFPPLSSIHSFNLPQPIGDRQTGQDEDEDQIRYVINRLVQKLLREH